MTAITPGTLEELIARERIRDCLYCYCRGIDRSDEAMLRSAYWPDGTDSHGPYQGSAEGFIQWAMKTLPHIERGIHQIHNVLIEFREGGAAVETYFSAFQRQPGADGKLTQWDMKGRYLDWFTCARANGGCRTGWWCSTGSRKCRSRPGPRKNASPLRKPVGGRWPDDPVYTFFA
jgi:hypothetical protein